MDVQRLCELSEAYVSLQNEIAKSFKRFVVSIYNSCNSMDHFIRVMQDLWRQHQGKIEITSDLEEYVEGCEFVADTWRSMMYDSLYMDIMNKAVFEYSAYNDLDMKEGDLEEYGFDFMTFDEAFRRCAEGALKYFITGQKIEEKVFRQVAILSIVQEYKANGIKLTLRQLYYQMVSKNYIRNLEAEYKKIIDMTGQMRENNVLEIDEFADNTRFALVYNYHEDIADFIKRSTDPQAYMLNSREGQEIYVETWIEKEALRSVFKPITDQYDVPLFICRGYPSTSSLFQQAKRILRKVQAEDNTTDVVILYFGDHDPSGLQIPQAIQNILHNQYQMKFVKVIPCALTMGQIKTYNLPPNPAKTTDPRAAEYMMKHGKDSWELDALPPLKLQDIIKDSITQHTDLGLMTARIKKQEDDKKHIKTLRQEMTEKARRYA